MNNLIPSDSKDRHNIEQKARDLREKFDLDYDDGGLCVFQLAAMVARLKDASHREYYVTFQRMVPKNIEGRILGLVDFNQRHVSLNCAVDGVKVPFILAHELGHIVLGHIAPGASLLEEDRSGILSEQEIQADYFAYCLLMPEDIFRSAAVICKNRLRLMGPMLNVPRAYLMRRYVMLKEGSLHFEIRDASFFRYHSNPEGIRMGYRDEDAVKSFIEEHNLDSSCKSYAKRSIVFDNVTYDCKIFNTKTEFGSWAIHCLAVQVEEGWSLQ